MFGGGHTAFVWCRAGLGCNDLIFNRCDIILAFGQRRTRRQDQGGQADGREWDHHLRHLHMDFQSGLGGSRTGSYMENGLLTQLVPREQGRWLPITLPRSRALLIKWIASCGRTGGVPQGKFFSSPNPGGSCGVGREMGNEPL